MPRLDNLTIGIWPGGELPVIGETMILQASTSGFHYEITPKRFTGLRWGEDGQLIIDLDGTKRLVPTESAE